MTEHTLSFYNQNQQISIPSPLLYTLSLMPNFFHACQSQAKGYSLLLRDQGRGRYELQTLDYLARKMKCIQRKSLKNTLGKMSKYAPQWTVDNYLIIERDYLLLVLKDLYCFELVISTYQLSLYDMY